MMKVIYLIEGGSDEQTGIFTAAEGSFDRGSARQRSRRKYQVL